jgi:hypothetical protein
MKSMDCASFERLAGDLTEGRLVPPLRAEMVAHAASCSRCAERFSDEQALTSDLRALAAATEDAETPEHVGRALLAAVRERQSEPVPVPAQTPRLPSGRPWLWGIAAALLLASGLGATRLGWRFAPVSRQSPAPSPSVAADTRAAPGLGSAARAPRKAATKASPPAPVVREKPAGAPRPVAVPPREASVTIEDAAEFVALDYGDTLADVESVHVVRVQLPPTALTALGWPMSEEADSRLVKADLLVGHDGVARAIRFVQ